MSYEEKLAAIKQGIGAHKDFPKKGIIFRDLLPVLRQPDLFEDVVSLLHNHIQTQTPGIQGVVGLEARGFLLGPVLALRLKVPFIAIRKPGKLPGDVKQVSFDLEYGSDTLEVQSGVLKNGQKVVIVDDLLATGGTMNAGIKLVQELGGVVKECIVVIELEDLKARYSIPVPVFSLVQFGD